ncbi:hypothetical protein [Nocardia asteroides]|nr:hypothetical protein [Nocardia asteroides]UGT61857.1 hypothetical protein LTT61_00425 [Nocardia asteroides]
MSDPEERNSVEPGRDDVEHRPDSTDQTPTDTEEQAEKMQSEGDTPT